MLKADRGPQWLLALCAMVPLASSAAEAEGGVGALLWQPSMNTFRRFDSEPEALFAFYRDVLGFEQLQTFSFNGNGGVSRIKAGATELKFTRRTPNRDYVDGGVSDATGLRLWTFFFADEAALIARFEANGVPAPLFEAVPGTSRRSALVLDPDGQPVELVITGDPPGTTYDEVEIGLTVSDLDASRAFYRDFAGLEELPPVHDARFDTTKYSFRHGATIVSLRSFGTDLPADTGSGGIQYVVSDVDRVAELAEARHVPVESPLSPPGAGLRTIWLGDPDGITNYFAETARSRGAAVPR